MSVKIELCGAPGFIIPPFKEKKFEASIDASFDAFIYYYYYFRSVGHLIIKSMAGLDTMLVF